MNFFQSLHRIGNPPSEAEKRQQEEVKRFHEELRPDAEKALALAKHLDEVFSKFVNPTIAKIEAMNIQDMWIGRYVQELRTLSGIPNQLRGHVHNAEGIAW